MYIQESICICRLCYGTQREKQAHFQKGRQAHYQTNRQAMYMYIMYMIMYMYESLSPSRLISVRQGELP